MLKHGILGLLSYGSMTGYDITRTFKDSLSYFWNAQTSQIYRELQTLKANGWATDETVNQTGKPDKKVFTITESGRKELNKWLTDDTAEFRMRSPMLMKIFFRGERSLDENIEYFRKLYDDCVNFALLMKNSPPNVEGYKNRVDDPSKSIYWGMTVEFGAMYAQMYMKWVENCMKKLEELKNENTVD